MLALLKEGRMDGICIRSMNAPDQGRIWVLLIHVLQAFLKAADGNAIADKLFCQGCLLAPARTKVQAWAASCM
jgi:hypothetical protein